MEAATRKRRIPGTERRELVLEAALAEFAELGYDGASMGRIGSAAGVTRSVLYDHFPSKQALFATLLTSKRRELLAALQGAILTGAPMRERMGAAFDAFFRFAQEDRDGWRLLYGEHAPVDAGAAAELRRSRRESNRLLAEMIAPDARRGGIDPASPVGVSMYAVQQAAIEGVVSWWFAHPRISREELLGGTMAALWDGLSALE